MPMEKLSTAANDISVMLQEAYRSERGIHAETLVAAAAAVTGEWALWALEMDLPQDGWIVSDGVNQITIEGPNAVARLVEAAVAHANGSPDKLPTADILAANAAAAMGKPGFPPLSVPARHLPQEWSPLAAPRFRHAVREIARQHGLSAHETCAACGLAVGLLIDATKDVLDPTVAGTLALEIMVGVTRMSPHETERFLAEETNS
jgi:hypothetical protein